MRNVIDLFCGGVGGWSVGLARAGFRTVAACEIDPWRRAVFQANHPNAIIYDDIRTLTAARLRADLGYLPDTVVGSPPCQEISAANCAGAGITDDHLFWEWARLVFELRPLWCAAENSPRARTAGIDGILDALDQAGYAAWPCVVGADNAGANHRRKRLWLVAADALRHELWLEPGRGSGARGRAASVVGGDDPDADGRLAGGAGRHADGLGRIFGRGAAQPAQADLYDDSDTNGTRHALGSRLGHHDGAELPAALRDIGLAWPHWNGGLSGLAAACAAARTRGMDDGLSDSSLAGLRNKCIAAYGDAVIPQIPEAIGLAMRALYESTNRGARRIDGDAGMFAQVEIGGASCR